MAEKHNNLQELRAEKERLKKEISELEALLTFENKKDSLSLLTNGFTDRFLSEKTENGETKISLKMGNAVKELGDALSSRNKKNSIVTFDNNGLQNSLLESTLKIGSVALLGNLAKKNIKSSNWKNKLVGVAIVYVLPFAIRLVKSKLDDYQKKKSLSSLEKLI